jgi:hypothetical protein
MDGERRGSERRRVLKRARIVFRNGHGAIDCVLLDISSGGAKLRGPGLLMVPDRFELRIENGPSHSVAVCFRGPDTAGVRFLPAEAA